ncbi:LOW QUALITY PROTEIN: hypothetical protein YC2023_020871 [Brassica napus]
MAEFMEEIRGNRVTFDPKDNIKRFKKISFKTYIKKETRVDQDSYARDLLLPTTDIIHKQRSSLMNNEEEGSLRLSPNGVSLRLDKRFSTYLEAATYVVLVWWTKARLHLNGVLSHIIKWLSSQLSSSSLFSLLCSTLTNASAPSTPTSVYLGEISVEVSQPHHHQSRLRRGTSGATAPGPSPLRAQARVSPYINS